MELTSKDNTWYWVVGTIVVLAVLYFMFKERIDRILGIAKDKATNEDYSCASTFYAKLEGNKIQNVWTSDEGTTTTPNVKYYKQDVVLTEDGVGDSGSPVVITKEEFIGLCKYKYNPPYAWYTAKAPSNTGHRGETNSANRALYACEKFYNDCSNKSGTQAWVDNRCDVLWNSCIGTWDRVKGNR